jgi:hypothetical protein
MFFNANFREELLETILEDIEERENDYVDFDDERYPYEIEYPSNESVEMWANHFGVSADKVCYPDISHHFLACIENDDWSGLDEDEEIALRNWMKRYYYCAPLTCVSGDYPEPSFSRCDITGLKSDCVPVVAFKR